MNNDIPVSTEDGGTLEPASVGEFVWHGYHTADIYDAQDTCLIAIKDGTSIPVNVLRRIPPERAALIAVVASKAGIRLERGTYEQVRVEAGEVGARGILGDWWLR